MGLQAPIRNNSSLADLNTSLTTVGSILEVINNDSLTSLGGLTGLTNVSFEVRVLGNDSLTSLTGLDNVTDVPYVRILDNPALTDPTGLTSLSTGTHLELTNNGLTTLNGLDSTSTMNQNLILASKRGVANLRSRGH